MIFCKFSGIQVLQKNLDSLYTVKNYQNLYKWRYDPPRAGSKKETVRGEEKHKDEGIIPKIVRNK